MKRKPRKLVPVKIKRAQVVKTKTVKRHKKTFPTFPQRQQQQQDSPKIYDSKDLVVTADHVEKWKKEASRLEDKSGVRRNNRIVVDFTVQCWPMTKGWSYNSESSIAASVRCEQYVKMLQSAARESMGIYAPFTKPVVAGFYFFLDKGELSGRPDISNLIKNAEDALSGIVWVDDSVILSYLPGTGKYPAEHEEARGTRVIVIPVHSLSYEEDLLWRRPFSWV